MKPIRLLTLGFLLLQTYSLVDAQVSTKDTPPPEVQFANGRSAGPIPFDRVGNFIYLRAQLNNSEPLWFLLDTGATSSYFDAERAQTLGLGLSIKNVTLGLPGLRVHKQNFSVRPLKLGFYNGHITDGLLGYDFISRFVIEIDYVNSRISLHDPRTYQYAGRGAVFPLTMLEDDAGGKVPLIRLNIMLPGRGPLEGNFIADTAVRSSISFNTPFVDAHKLLHSVRQVLQAPLGGGAMVRESNQSIARLSHIHFGRLTIRKPIAIFFQDKQGVLASPEFDGVLGSEILSRFKVVFDYSRQELVLEPTRHISDLEEYDQSGLLLTAEGTGLKTFRVRRMIENSPATVARIREGDIISAINGKRVSSLTLEQLRQMFKQGGRSYRLTLKRDGQEIQTKIKLVRLI
jgi:PDZ domain/Aspartyl protease